MMTIFIASCMQLKNMRTSWSAHALEPIGYQRQQESQTIALLLETSVNIFFEDNISGNVPFEVTMKETTRAVNDGDGTRRNTGDSESYFHLAVSGQLESAYFPMGPDSGSLFCRYDVVAGPDWELVSGMRSGITQSAKPEGDYRTVVFNMPLEFTMKSTNPYGWPQIVFSMYGNNLWNVETNRGYARIHCPLMGMRRTVRAPLFVPKFSNIWSAAMSWITGVNAEMRDPKILADGSKHKGLATESYGELVVRLQAISRGCNKMGLDWGQSYD